MLKADEQTTYRSMTERQQKRFYFPAWRACAESLDWIMCRQRLQCHLPTLRVEVMSVESKWPEPARSAMLQVLEQSEAIAGRDHRGVTAEDLRHGCNLV